MKLAILCLWILSVSVALAFDAPSFEAAEEGRGLNKAYHNVVDNLVCNNAFKWSNSTAGTFNQAYLNTIIAAQSAYLGSITTSTFRQCDRLNSFCYQCENGAENVSIASVNLLRDAKLFCQKNGNQDSVAERISDEAQTFTLLYSVEVPVFTATIPCRVTPGCYPSSVAQLSMGELQNDRELTFKKVAGQILLDRINTGARTYYISAAETGIGARLLNMNLGQELVPDSIINDRSLTGIFCVFAKRQTEHYAHRGFATEDPW